MRAHFAALQQQIAGMRGENAEMKVNMYQCHLKPKNSDGTKQTYQPQ